MECLYFYCDEELPLATNIKYESDYLEQVGGQTCPHNPETNSWWGSKSELSAKTNCKLENHLTNKHLKLWTPEGGIVKSFEELEALMGEGRWRLKDPWLMGGTGQWRLSREMLYDDALRRGITKRLNKGNLLLERSLEIKNVIGTTFDLTDSTSNLLFCVENFLNSQGNFIGGKVTDLPEVLKSQVYKVSEYWRDLGARGVLEIDSFILDDGYYPCVEVNHRKTMGWFIWNLSQKLGSGEMRLNHQDGIKLNPKNSALEVSWVKI